MRVWRGLWLVLVVGTGVVGGALTMVTSNLSTQVTGVSFGGVVAVLIAWAREPAVDPSRFRPRAGKTVEAALLGGWAGWCLTGPLLVLGGATLVLVLLLLAVSPPAVRRLTSHRFQVLGPQADAPLDRLSPTSESSRLDPHKPGGVEPTAADAALFDLEKKPSQLDDADLCLLWRRSYTALNNRCSVHQALQLVRLRQQLLDEIELRNPAGFRRWLYTGARPASDPTRYLR